MNAMSELARAIELVGHFDTLGEVFGIKLTHDLIWIFRQVGCDPKFLDTLARGLEAVEWEEGLGLTA
jgi:hypothetical protein